MKRAGFPHDPGPAAESAQCKQALAWEGGAVVLLVIGLMEACRNEITRG